MIPVPASVRVWLATGVTDSRQPGPIIGGACWSHSRRKFYELADIAASKRRGKSAPPISPLALEAVKRIDVHTAIPAAASRSWSRSMVRCGVSPTSQGTRSRCVSNRGGRRPPIRSGATLPLPW